MSKRLRLDSTGLRIAKPGRAYDSGDSNDLLVGPGILNTRAKLHGVLTNGNKYSQEKFTSTGGDVTYSGNYVAVVNHDLGYVPIYNFSIGLANGNFPYVIVDENSLRYYAFRYTDKDMPPDTYQFAYPLTYTIFYDRWV